MTLDDALESPCDFTAYCAARLPTLRELAYALTGDPQQAAELSRAALVRTGRRWSRLRSDPARDLAVVTALVRRYLAGYRDAVVVDQRPSQAEQAADRAKPPPAIAQLTGVMRAVLVLRYVGGWSDSQIASAVKASRGTVRSRAGRGLAQLTGAGLLSPGPDPDPELVRRLLVPPGSLPPPDPTEAAEIAAEARRGRRRRRLTAAAGLTVVAAGAVVAAITLGPGLLPVEHSAASPAPAFLARPQTSGSIPEPVVKQVADLNMLATALPGMSLTKLDLGELQLRGTTPLGTLLGSSGAGRDTQVVEFDPATGTQTVLADAKLPFVDLAAGDERTVVWMEAEHEQVEGGYQQRRLTVRCLDRASGQVRTVRLPKANPIGVPYPDTGNALMKIAIGDGRIALSIGGFGDGRALSQAADLYLAGRCGEPLELLAEGASAPRFVGAQLYYLHFDGVSEGVWRQPVEGGVVERQLVAARAGRYLTTDDAILWDARNDVGFAGGTPDLHVARLDGSAARPVPSVEDLDIAGAARTALAGQIWDPNSSTVHSAGLWLYLPSWGAILSMSILDGGTERWLTVHEGGANALLVTEFSDQGASGRVWLLQLP